MATSPTGRGLRCRSAALLATAALGLVAFAGGAAQASAAAAAPAAPAAPAALTTAGSHALPAGAAGPGFVMADPAPPPTMPAPLDTSGPAQVQALEQQYETDAADDEQKANQLAGEKTTLEQRAGDVQNRESSLATQASSLEDQANSLNSQAQALNSQIDAHNAEPHTFELPDQEAAYEAYNEEKASLDAQKTSLQNQINAVTAQSDKLQSDQAQADADQTQLETDVQTHNDAVSALENDVGQLEVERQQILSQIDDLLQNDANAQQGGEDAPLADAGGDESDPAATAAPPAQTEDLPTGGGDESAPADETYTPVESAPTGSGSSPAEAASEPAPVTTQTPVRVTLSPSTVSGLSPSQAENLNPSETFDGLIPEANGDYAAEEVQPPAGEPVPPARKAFDDAIDNGGKATTPIGGRPATIDKIEPESAAPAENAGGDTPRPVEAAPPRSTAPDWVPKVNEPNPEFGPPVSIDALHDTLDQQGLGSEAGQFDLEYEPVVLDEEGSPTYGSAPTDAEGDPELGSDGKPVLRFSNLGLQNPETAVDTFEDEALDHELSEGGEPCIEHSFSGSTRVLMADGSTKAISDVHVGDLIRNAQPGGGTEVHRVDVVHVTTTDSAFVDVVVGTQSSPESVVGTANHPFYDISAGGFVNAGRLHAGDRLQTGTDTPATVDAVRAQVGPLVTYDLTIDGLHTYFVVAGETPVLVHNAPALCPHSNAIGKLGDTRFGSVLQRFFPDSKINSQFRILTPYGYREADYAVEDGNGGYDLFEVKTNSSKYTKIQQLKDAWIQQNLGWSTTVVRLSEPCAVCH